VFAEMIRFPAFLKSWLHRLVAQKGCPKEIALGFALGIFIGMSPFFLCHTVTAVLLAAAFGWNRVSAALGVFITNPVTLPFFYGLTYQVGAWLTGSGMDILIPEAFNLETFLWVIQSAPKLLWIMTVGGIVTGLPLAAAGYYLALWAVRRHRSRHPRPRPVCDSA
jgi:uncharacterized protein (DUF2062 family)